MILLNYIASFFLITLGLYCIVTQILGLTARISAQSFTVTPPQAGILHGLQDHWLQSLVILHEPVSGHQAQRDVRHNRHP